MSKTELPENLKDPLNLVIYLTNKSKEAEDELKKHWGKIIEEVCFLPILERMPEKCFINFKERNEDRSTKPIKGVLVGGKKNLTRNLTYVALLQDAIYSFEREDEHPYVFYNRQRLDYIEIFENRFRILSNLTVTLVNHFKM